MVTLKVRRVRNVAADLALGAVLPLAAVAVLAGARVLGTSALAVALLALAARWWQERRRLEFRWEVLGQYQALRGLGAAAVAAVVVGPARDAADIVGAALAAAVLGTLLVLEPRTRGQVETRIPVVVNLPGVPAARERPMSQLTMLVLHAAALLAGVVVAALGAPALVWTALTLVPLGYAVGIAREGARRRRLAREVMAAAPAAVAAYAPQIVLHTAHMGPNYHQAMMWLPYLQRTGLRTLVLTRYPGPSHALRDRVGDVPLVQAPELTDLDAMMVGSVKAVFYPNAKLGNSSVIRRHPWVRHVFLGHGDSDKSTSYAPSHAVYDTIFSAGPAAVRRYADHGVLIAPEKFEVVGRPQVEDVQPERGPIAGLGSPTVLYAPTWKGFTSETSLSSLSLGLRIVRGLLRTRATVIFRPHPSSYNFVRDRVHIAAIHELLAADAAKTGRAHLFGPAADTELDSIGCMNRADAMISDVSGVASDFLFSGKPLAIVAVGADVDDFVRRFPVSRGGYVLERDLANLDGLLEQMLGADPMHARRLEIRADYLGDFGVQDYASVFVDAARRAGTTDKRGATRPVRATAAAANARAAQRPTTLRARLGLVRRTVQGRLKELPGWAWFAAVLLGGGALATGLAGSRLLTAVLVVLATVLLVRVPVEPRRPRTLFRLVGEDSVARALLVVAVLAAVVRPDGLAPGPALLACGLGAAVASERLVREWSEQWPLTRNVPGLDEGRGEPYPGLLVVLTAVVELLVLAVPTPLVTGTAGVALVLAAVAVVAMGLRRIGSGRAVDAAWRAGLASYDPRYVIFVGTNINPGDSLSAWLPHLERLGERFVILTHYASSVDEVDRACRAAGLTVPIVFRPKFRGLDRAITPGMNAALYVHNSLLNNQMVSRRELNHVLLNNREGEGGENWSPMAAMYDQVFVPGRVARDRYARHDVRIPEQKFRIVGRPQLSGVELRRPRAAGEAPTVLYLPMFFRTRGGRPSSLPAAPVVVAALLARGARVLFRPDEAWSRYTECRAVVAEVTALLEADAKASGREHQVVTKGAASRAGLVGLMNASDALVSDTVPPLYDYLRSDKPFALLVGTTGADATAPVVDAAYPLAADGTDVEAVLDDLLGADPRGEVRARMREAYLGPNRDDDDYAAAFVTAACQAMAARPAAALNRDMAEEEE